MDNMQNSLEQIPSSYPCHNEQQLLQHYFLWMCMHSKHMFMIMYLKLFMHLFVHMYAFLNKLQTTTGI